MIMVSHLVDSAMQHATKILHLGTEMEFFGSHEEYRKTELSEKFLGKRGEGNE